jgi:hypothetical protein
LIPPPVKSSERKTDKVRREQRLIRELHSQVEGGSCDEWKDLKMAKRCRKKWEERKKLIRSELSRLRAEVEEESGQLKQLDLCD